MNETEKENAKKKVEEICHKLLTNLVIENYKIIEGTPKYIWFYTKISIFIINCVNL